MYIVETVCFFGKCVGITGVSGIRTLIRCCGAASLTILHGILTKCLNGRTDSKTILCNASSEGLTGSPEAFGWSCKCIGVDWFCQPIGEAVSWFCKPVDEAVGKPMVVSVDLPCRRIGVAVDLFCKCIGLAVHCACKHIGVARVSCVGTPARHCCSIILPILSDHVESPVKAVDSVKKHIGAAEGKHAWT